MEAENIRLKQELNFAEQLPDKSVSARIIGRSNNGLLQQIIVDAGSEAGLNKWQMVLANNQLIGRVVQVSKNYSKILLLTDLASRIPVMTVNSRTKFIAAGEMNKYLSCKYLNEHQQLQEVELVVTNGDDVEIPANIIVGAIIKQDNNFYIKPNLDFDQLEFVQILQTKQDE